MTATKTLNPIHELSFEQVSHYRVVPLSVVLRPLLRLLQNRKLVKGKLLVFRFFRYSIQFVMHSVDQKPHELLSVLLSET
jgi:hypothetical protein